MSPEALERLLKLLALLAAGAMEAQAIINNHKAQEGKTNEQILTEAEAKTNEALEIINKL